MAASDRNNHASSLHILVVEDGLVYQKLAVHLLEDHGHTVTLANNGKEAIDLIPRQGFDLVLMDVEMPEMDGLEATCWIRRHGRQTGSHIPILGLTTIPDPQRCLTAGMDAYLRKPYSPSNLLEEIERVVDPSTRNSSPQNRKRILLVDDDPEIIEPLRYALEEQGHTVIATTGGQEALEMADRHSPDLIVLDIIMPHCNGLQLLQQLREAGLEELPVIVMTGSHRDAYKAQAQELGAKEFLQKPFPPTRIVESVNRLLAA